MTTSAAATTVVQLRSQRRDLRRELARVRWWRQLVKARRDVSVAALTQPEGIGGLDLDATWEALAADAPTWNELASAIWPDGTGVTPAIVSQLDTLDSRLDHYESRVTENLESVTAQLVVAMSVVHQTVDTRERDLA